jgi:hypothetical protein
MLSHRLTDLSTIATDWRFGLIGVALSRSDGAILYWPSIALDPSTPLDRPNRIVPLGRDALLTHPGQRTAWLPSLVPPGVDAFFYIFQPVNCLDFGELSRAATFILSLRAWSLVRPAIPANPYRMQVPPACFCP